MEHRGVEKTPSPAQSVAGRSRGGWERHPPKREASLQRAGHQLQALEVASDIVDLVRSKVAVLSCWDPRSRICWAPAK